MGRKTQQKTSEGLEDGGPLRIIHFSAICWSLYPAAQRACAHSQSTGRFLHARQMLDTKTSLRQIRHATF